MRRQPSKVVASLPKAHLPVRVCPSASGEGGCPFKPGQVRGCRAQPVHLHLRVETEESDVTEVA